MTADLDSYGYRKTFRVALPQIIAVAIKNISLMVFATFMGYVTILIPAVQPGGYDESMQLTKEQTSWISSITLICVPVGCTVSGYLATAIGRKRAMQVINLPFLLAWIILYISNSVWTLYLALVLAGLAGGLLEAPVMVYVAEVSQPHLRGMLASTSTLSFIIGIVLQFFLGIFFRWRNVALINSIIPITAIISLCFIPESPHWLLYKNREDEARKGLKWLRGQYTLEAVEKELNDISMNQRKPAAGSSDTSNSLKLYATKSFAYAFSLVTLGFFLLHFCGMTTVQTYAVLIFDKLNTPINKYYATLILGLVEILGIIIFISLIHRVGKRPMVFFSTIGCAMCLIVVAVYAHVNGDNTNDLTAAVARNVASDCFDKVAEGCADNVANFTVAQNSTIGCGRSAIIQCVPKGSSWVSLVFLILFATISHSGMRVLPWILIGEVFSIETRSTASGISAGMAHILGFAANKLFLGMVSALTLSGTFGLYACIGLSGALVFYFYLPETEGYTLTDIAKHFSGEEKLPNQVYKPQINQDLPIDNNTNNPMDTTQPDYLNKKPIFIVEHCSRL